MQSHRSTGEPLYRLRNDAEVVKKRFSKTLAFWGWLVSPPFPFSLVSFSPPSCLSRMVWSFGTLPNGLFPLSYVCSFLCVCSSRANWAGFTTGYEGSEGSPKASFPPLPGLLRHRKSKSLVLHNGFDTVFWHKGRQEETKKETSCLLNSIALACTSWWMADKLGRKSSRFLYAPSFSISLLNVE